MADKETVLLDGKPHEVEVKPLTLICSNGGVRVDVPSRVEISPRHTVPFLEEMPDNSWDNWRQDLEFQRLYKIVHPDGKILATAHSDLPERTLGEMHVAGMVMQLLICLRAGRQPFVRLPETYLHPAQQAQLAELFLELQKVKPVPGFPGPVSPPPDPPRKPSSGTDWW